MPNEINFGNRLSKSLPHDIYYKVVLLSFTKNFIWLKSFLNGIFFDCSQFLYHNGIHQRQNWF